MDIRTGDNSVALSDLSIYYTWKNMKKLCENNKFKVSETTWVEELELPDGSHSASYIQDHLNT